jgi:hypothetical protein
MHVLLQARTRATRQDSQIADGLESIGHESRHHASQQNSASANIRPQTATAAGGIDTRARPF